MSILCSMQTIYYYAFYLFVYSLNLSKVCIVANELVNWLETEICSYEYVILFTIVRCKDFVIVVLLASVVLDVMLLTMLTVC